MERIIQAKAFFHTGVNYTGAFPFDIELLKHKKPMFLYLFV